MHTPEPVLARRGPTAGTPKTARSDVHRHLSRAQLLELRNAYLFAEASGTPLNTWLTINFKASRHYTSRARTAEAISRVKGCFLKALDDWCRRNDVPLVQVYVLENLPQGGPGPHLHILQHLPPERWHKLREALHRFLKKTGGWPDEHFAPEQTWKPLDVFGEELSLEAPAGGNRDPLRRLRYMAKGANPQEVVTLDGERITLAQLSERMGTAAKPDIKLEPQGDARVSKRAGSSKSIGKAARKAAGWTEERDLLWLCPELDRRRIRADVRDKLNEWFRSTAARVELDAVRH